MVLFVCAARTGPVVMSVTLESFGDNGPAFRAPSWSAVRERGREAWGVEEGAREPTRATKSQQRTVCSTKRI